MTILKGTILSVCLVALTVSKTTAQEADIRPSDINTIRQFEAYLLARECSGYWIRGRRGGQVVIRFKRIGPYLATIVQYDRNRPKTASLDLMSSGSQRILSFRWYGQHRLTLSKDGNLSGTMKRGGAVNSLQLNCRYDSSRRNPQFEARSFTSRADMLAYLINGSPFSGTWRWCCRDNAPNGGVLSGSVEYTFSKKADHLTLRVGDNPRKVYQVSIDAAEAEISGRNFNNNPFRIWVVENGDLVGVQHYPEESGTFAATSAIAVRASPSQ